MFIVTMKVIIFFLLLGIQEAAAVTHSLKYFYTGSSQVPNFPEFVTVGMVDDVQVDYYDSDMEKTVPKQDWFARNTDQQYWERETAANMGSQQTFKAGIENIKQRFNQTGGVHIFQQMYSCEWDDETDEVNGYEQFGYDGEDFLFFDLKTETWVALKHQAVITKHRWDNDRAWSTQARNYFTQICPEWLKKYVNYGRSSLMKTVFPSVSLLQKTPSFPVSCHATGFYPNRAEMVWRKDGEEIHEGVNKGEILTNNDGTFQMSVDLDLSSVRPEDWQRYDCVFQLSGMNEDIVTKLGKAAIRTNEGSSVFPAHVVIRITGILLLLTLCFSGVFIWRRKYKVPPSVSLLQKSPSSRVTCHATGFYPNRAELVWRKHGVELHEGVNKGEILRINDGNFQMSVNLDLSSVRPEDWERYDCVFQLSGVNEDIVTKLDKAVIRTNKGKSDEGKSLAILIIIAMLFLL